MPTQVWRDHYNRLAVLALLVLGGIYLLEWTVPNSKRLQTTALSDSSIDFMPARFTWAGDGLEINGSALSLFLFSYGNLLLASLLVGLILLAWNLVSSRRCEELRAQVDRADSISDLQEGSATRTSAEFLRNRLRIEEGNKKSLVEPLIGAYLLCLLAWLCSAIIASKLDYPWSRPFLAPPMLVAQNLQVFGSDLLAATLRSAWHMFQGVTFGCAAGITLGFLLSHVPWLRSWTAWHVTVLAALPPFLLGEVFRQVVRHPAIPIFGVHNEIAFKLAISMASWAVMWPVLTATALALRSIDSEYRRSIRLLGARSTWEHIKHVELPVIAHPVLANLRVGFVIGLIVLLYGEGYGSPRTYPTLGLWFSDITNNFKLQTLMAFIAFTSLLVIVVEISLRAVERNLFPTRRPHGWTASVFELRPSAAEERRRCLETFELARSTKWPEPPWRTINWADEAFRVSGIKKTFGGKLAFEVPKGKPVALGIGEFLSIIGRSGAGKSTFLKLLLGFEEPDRVPGSTLRLGGVDLLKHRGRDLEQRLEPLVAYVSQKPLLLPHRTVAGNIFFGIQHQLAHIKESSADRALERFYEPYLLWLLGLEAMADLKAFGWQWPDDDKTDPRILDSPLGLFVRFMGLDDKMSKYPAELSGGEAQRVHLLRWIVLARPILIMDEAFSALDQPLKGMVRDAIQRHASALGLSVVNVSHDRADVLQISDRIMFIDDQSIADEGEPRALYYAPRTAELALFLGHTNLFEVTGFGSSQGTALIGRDIYRQADFCPPVEVVFEAGIQRASRGRSSDLRGNGGGNRWDGNGRSKVFIPRSNVNVAALWLPGQRLVGADSMDGFRIDSKRFTGTHYEIRWIKEGVSSALRIESVIQDDELTAKMIEAGLTDEQLETVEARLAIGLGVLLDN